MRQVLARPPTGGGSGNRRMFQGFIAAGKDIDGTTNGQPDPFRYSVVNILPPARPVEYGTIAGSVGAGQLTGVDLADGDRVTLFWNHTEQSSSSPILPHCRCDMVYEASSGLLRDDQYTMGDDWNYYDEGAQFNKDTRALGGAVDVYVQVPQRNVLIYWLIKEWILHGVMCNVTIEPTTQIIAGRNGPLIRRYDAYASVTDYYWERERFGTIFPGA